MAVNLTLMTCVTGIRKCSQDKSTNNMEHVHLVNDTLSSLISKWVRIIQHAHSSLADNRDGVRTSHIKHKSAITLASDAN